MESGAIQLFKCRSSSASELLEFYMPLFTTSYSEDLDCFDDDRICKNVRAWIDRVARKQGRVEDT